ncbi:MAG: type IV toxin-antitoxin system AbiEi family antitoxin domain-containing protein [Lachnospiraceae bacterium]|nr:type IV toxin-antitoxin system AbiEi family antitoxin domain-containing protein [Lachnospiraceae bacterium]
MRTMDEIKKLFSQHDYIMRTAELRASKIYYEDIQKLLNDGVIEKVKQGYYHLLDEDNISEICIINRLFPDAVICMNTALFYYGYNDRTPFEWHLAVDKDISKYRIKIDYPFVKVYFFEASLLNLGAVVGSIDSNNVNIYDRDRTICDCLRYMGKMDKEIFYKAVQGYVKDPKKNIPNLMKYAKQLRVSKKVKDLIGVWL